MSKFQTPSKVLLVLVVAQSEADKTAFIKTLFPADTEVKTVNKKIISVADYKQDKLYVFKKPSEGPQTLIGFDDCHEVQMTPSAVKELEFYSKVATLVNTIDERSEGEKK